MVAVDLVREAPLREVGARADTLIGITSRSHLATKSAVMLADAVAIVAAMLAALAMRSLLPGKDPISAAGMHMLLGLTSLPVWLAVFTHHRLYVARCITTRLEEWRRVVHGAVVSSLAIAVFGFSFQVYVARGWLLLTLALSIAFITAERELVRRAFARRRRRGQLLRPVVIVGGNGEGVDICAQLVEHPELGYSVVGFVDEHAVAGTYLYDHRPVLGTVDQTLDAVRRSGATSVIIASTAMDADASNRILRLLTDAGIHVEVSSTLRDIDAQRLTVRPLGAYPMMYVEPVRRDGWRALAKRGLDVSLSSLLLLLSAPVLLIAAISIRLDSRGPVVFTQERVGKDGRRFRVHKLRTMVADAEELVIDLRDQNDTDGPMFKMRDDPRVTRVGRLLRKWSIDEIPQFWNVLRGDMSLVGPRPSLPDELDGWSSEAHNRLRVKPGLTGMWQVSGRSDTGFEQYVRLDLYYVDNWSLWTDLAIVAKTVPTVLFSRGAY